MANFWNTGKKRTTTMIVMIVAAWYLLRMTFPSLPTIPNAFTQPTVMGISFMTLVGAYLMYATYMMFNSELNG